MKKLCLGLCLLILMGCSHRISEHSDQDIATVTANVENGMTKKQVINIMGTPDAQSMNGNKVCFSYRLYDDKTSRSFNTFHLAFKNNKLYRIYQNGHCDDAFREK